MRSIIVVLSFVLMGCDQRDAFDKAQESRSELQIAMVEAKRQELRERVEAQRNTVSGSGITGVSDTSIIGYTVSVNGDTLTKYLYTFDRESYGKAFYAIQLSLIPFNSLNPGAQRDYVEGLKYIKDVRGLPINGGKK